MKENADYRIIEEGLISVCMNCHPGESILETHPELRGKVSISHGLCPTHKAVWLAELKAFKR